MVAEQRGVTPNPHFIVCIPQVYKNNFWILNIIKTI